jgi:hypothetical protein
MLEIRTLGYRSATEVAAVFDAERARLAGF